MGDWSDLPGPALDLISKSVTFYLDYVHFRSVCRSWRSAAPRRPHLPLLAGHCFDDNRLLTVFNFFEFTGSEIFPVACGHQLSETSLGRICCGSSHGWMAFLDPNLDVDLWNPLTKSHIQLPTLAGYNGIDFSTEAGKEILRYRDGGAYKEITAASFREIRRSLANKLILSSDPSVDPDCVALLLHCQSRRVAVCRIGDSAWTPVRCGELCGVDTDAVFYKGRFHISSHQALYALNLGAEPELERILMANPPLDEWSCLPMIDLCYLVESAGDLLVVTAYNSEPSPSPSVGNSCLVESSGRLFVVDVYNTGSLPSGGKNYSFEVYKVDWGMHRMMLIKLRSLGDRALFLGRNHSFSLPTSDLPGCRPNCFYMANLWQRAGANIWVYDMEDGSNSMIPIHSADPSSLCNPCTWITPSLLC